jgi:hypothetical protein
MPPTFHALTIKGAGPLAVLITDCHASAAFDPRKTPQGTPTEYHPFKAIWDTGATGSVITQAVVDACGLRPTGMVQVHGVHGPEFAETFLVNIALPNGVAFPNVRVTKGKILGPSLLIGMDIITTGDFSITNVGMQTVFTFRIPSIHTIDYVEEANQLKAKAAANAAHQPFYKGVTGKKKHR